MDAMFAAVLDPCVLVPNALCDTLIRVELRRGSFDMTLAGTVVAQPPNAPRSLHVVRFAATRPGAQRRGPGPARSQEVR
ncbi:MAG: hypothetical protein ACRDYZ_04465 [Acidimicrobiales bacterium]